MIRVLFENADILAVDKPAGISAIPERNPGKESALSYLSKSAREKLYVVHRLDKETSGILVFAKNAGAHRMINNQFADRMIRKTYTAITLGIINREKGVIDSSLRSCGSGRIKVDRERVKPCVTEFEVEKRFQNNTLVRIHPLTGRRHQIRVHFYGIGHPIAGDPLYGKKEEQRRYPRLMLHASSIQLSLPGGASITLESPLPEIFESFPF